MQHETDIVIIGGGVAGLTAALAARQAGLHSIVLERRHEISDGPGESMHPGIAPLIEKLGFLQEFEEIATGRFSGIDVHHQGSSHFTPFGQTDGKDWLGYHICRADLNQLLLSRMAEPDSDFRPNFRVRDIAFENDELLIVKNEKAQVSGKWILDASGVSGLSARRIGSGYHKGTDTQMVSYWYEPEESSGRPLAPPRLNLKSWGWEWRAPLGNGLISCVELYRSTDVRNNRKPRDAKSADGTWVVAQQPASGRLFRIGDAAMRFDPSSGKGIMRAFMTAMKAVFLIQNVRESKLQIEQACGIYNQWVRDWFESDARELRQLLNV